MVEVSKSSLRLQLQGLPWQRARPVATELLLGTHLGGGLTAAPNHQGDGASVAFSCEICGCLMDFPRSVGGQHDLLRPSSHRAMLARAASQSPRPRGSREVSRQTGPVGIAVSLVVWCCRHVCHGIHGPLAAMAQDKSPCAADGECVPRAGRLRLQTGSSPVDAPCEPLRDGVCGDTQHLWLVPGKACGFAKATVLADLRASLHGTAESDGTLLAAKGAGHRGAYSSSSMDISDSL